MRLITFHEVGFTWRKPPILEDVSLAIDTGERIGLLGRNGTGKSTLLKLIAGDIQPDHGTVRTAPKLRISRLIQEVPDDVGGTISDVISGGWVAQSDHADEDATHHHQWQLEAALDRTLTRMQLDPTRPFVSLSAGLKRRTLLGRAIISQPDLLLLDEPTNHLDIESILWLEDFLKGYSGAYIFVTHDRAFLRALASRILEIDRGRLLDWECDYTTFLKRKADVLAAEEKQDALFDKKLAQEEVWIRKGIEARRTRNEGRVRALEAMRKLRVERRKKIGDVKMQATTLERSGELVAELTDVSFAYDSRPIINKFSTLISRGDKIGIVGPNGAGKSTLIKLLLGQLQPTAGKIRLGTKLETLYFDQLREQIDGEKSVADNVSDGGDQVVLQGKPRHIYGYLQDFLFTPERSRQPAKFLSGGERNRLLLARLFKRTSNLLVLDEPTNDLDEETLELLEEIVSSYEGTLLLVSHDREFLNNVVTSVLALDGDGNVTEYGGGYDDYARQKALQSPKATTNSTSGTTKASSATASATAKPTKSKLSFKEQKELESLPAKIEQAETERESLHTAMASPGFYQQESSAITAAVAQLAKIDEQLALLYARWEELESRNG
jgi:ATP-binding cassette subfamily F protein uup